MLLKAQATARVDAHSSPFFLQCGRTKESTTCVQIFHENAWISAQRTTDHDPVNVILDEKEKKKDKKGIMQIFNSCNFMRIF